MSGDHRYSREVLSNVSTDYLRRTINVAPDGVAVLHADCPRGWRIHGPGGGGLGKQVSSKTNGTGENLRDSEESTGPRSQERRAWDTEPGINDRRKTQDLTGVQQTPGGVPDYRRDPLRIST